MKVLVLALLGLLALAYADTQFTATFEMRASYLGVGSVVDGKLSYSWPTTGKGFIRFDYPNQKYYEIEEYNNAKGYGKSSSALANQWNYRVGQACNCETGALDHTMPPLSRKEKSPEADILAKAFTGPTKKTIRGVDLEIYTIKNDVNTIAEYAGVEGFVVVVGFRADGTLGYFQYDDGTEFDIKGQTDGVNDKVFNEGTSGCSCGRPIDIAIVLDRSGSINAIEWRDQKEFMKGFISQFDYGPLGANVAIVNFNKDFWVDATLAQGSTKEAITNIVNSMKCCDAKADDWQKNPTTACCCCGTSISGGMYHGAKELEKSTRNVATKVIVTVTDGFHNTQVTGASCGQYPKSYQDKPCRGDLYYTVKDCEAMIEKKGQKLIMYAVGVGDDRSFSKEELIICAQEDASRLITAVDFAQLVTKTLELVARTCNENRNPCGGGCCGFCVCSTCQKVDRCDTPDNKCLIREIGSQQTCCQTKPKQCPPNTPCASYTCNNNTGECDGALIPLPPDTPCTSYSCDPVKGVIPKDLPCQDTTPECEKNEDCDDKNACTDNICENGKCRYPILNCSENGFPDDKCSSVECFADKGCVRTPFPDDYCNDNSVCTNETCVIGTGCVYKDIDCKDDNLCTDDTCHPTLGCLNSQKICNASIDEIAKQNNVNKDRINKNCTLGYCEEGACKSKLLNCSSPITTAIAIGAGLGAAALAGIIIAAIVLAGGLVGGGAYAYTQAAGAGNVSVTGNNPLYAGSGTSGTNVLYRA